MERPSHQPFWAVVPAKVIGCDDVPIAVRVPLIRSPELCVNRTSTPGSIVRTTPAATVTSPDTTVGPDVHDQRVLALIVPPWMPGQDVCAPTSCLEPSATARRSTAT